ncbi:MAG: hypothetical protein KGO94_09455, partial [Alphaproteobacteria bacterium]|nr:hypothetical protein [Alphaproteobacteria bacterium]
MPDGPGYDAFISYRRSDGARAAARLRKRLLSFKLPKSLLAGTQQRRLSIFMDTAYERGAADFYDQTIKPALMSARWLIIIATPDAVQRDKGDDWISREVQDFSKGSHRTNVILARAKGEFLDRMPADVDKRFPHMQIVDIRNDSFFSHLSPQVNARFNNEILKIAGPLFDVSLDNMPKLRREEEKRQMFRLGMVSGVLASLVAATIGASYYTFSKANEALHSVEEGFAVSESNILSMAGEMGADSADDENKRLRLFSNCEHAARLQELSVAASIGKVAKLICRMQSIGEVGKADKAKPEDLKFRVAELRTLIGEAKQLRADPVDE